MPHPSAYPKQDPNTNPFVKLWTKKPEIGDTVWVRGIYKSHDQYNPMSYVEFAAGPNVSLPASWVNDSEVIIPTPAGLLLSEIEDELSANIMEGIVAKDSLYRYRELRDWPEQGDELPAAVLLEWMRQVCEAGPCYALFKIETNNPSLKLTNHWHVKYIPEGWTVEAARVTEERNAQRYLGPQAAIAFHGTTATVRDALELFGAMPTRVTQGESLIATRPNPEEHNDYFKYGKRYHEYLDNFDNPRLLWQDGVTV